jgi:hypothetical protein
LVAAVVREEAGLQVPPKNNVLKKKIFLLKCHFLIDCRTAAKFKVKLPLFGSRSSPKGLFG